MQLRQKLLTDCREIRYEVISNKGQNAYVEEFEFLFRLKMAAFYYKKTMLALRYGF